MSDPHSSSPQSSNEPPDLAHAQDVAIGDILIRPSLRIVVHGNKRVEVEPKVMQLLLAFARNPGVVLSRDDLFDLCWTGQLVGEGSLNRALSLLRSALRDVGSRSVSLQTVPRVGYRLVASVGEPASRDLNSTPKVYRRTGILAFGLVLLVAAAIASFVLLYPDRSDQDRVVRLLVLPIETEQQESPFLAQGLRDEIRRELGAHPSVVALTPSMADMTGADVTEVLRSAEMFDAGYVLRLTAQPSRGALAVNAQLFERSSGDIVLEQIVARDNSLSARIPERLARYVTESMGLEPTGRELVGLERDDDLEQYMLASGYLHTRDPKRMEDARRILHGVVKRNPEFADGWGLLSKAYTLSPESDPNRAKFDLQRAEEFALRALSISPQSVEALKVLGLHNGPPDEKIEALKRAVGLDPGDSEALYWLSLAQKGRVPPLEELSVLKSVVANDPLWNRSWQVTTDACQLGATETALSMDDQVATAATETWQRDFARARQAKHRGELAKFYRETEKLLAQTSGGDRAIAQFYLTSARLLLEQPSIPGTIGTTIGARTARGDFPSRVELEDAGFSDHDAWHSFGHKDIIPGLMLIAGRRDELLASYDAVFDTPATFMEELVGHTNGLWRGPHLATYLAFALREGGRKGEAKEMAALARKVLESRQIDGNPTGMQPAMALAQLEAFEGNNEAAAAAFGQAIDFGWPHCAMSTMPSVIGPLSEDPLFSQVKTTPRFRALLTAIRGKLEAERRKLAAGPPRD